jgi:hypothetical protein
LATGIRTRLTSREGRRFGVVVGAAFGALAALAAWRGADLVPWVLGGIGATLVAAGLLVPTRLGPVQSGWMSLAAAISKVTTPIVMGVIYFVVITPVGLLRRAFGGNPPKAGDGSTFWVSRPSGPENRGDMTRQF